MILRWLVKKIVKYILQELIESEDFKWLMQVNGSHKKDTEEKKQLGPLLPRSSSGLVEVDSMQDLANAMSAVTSDVKIEMRNESKTVSSNKKRNDDMIKRLSEIGD